jgi:hypothetical protein
VAIVGFAGFGFVGHGRFSSGEVTGMFPVGRAVVNPPAR